MPAHRRRALRAGCCRRAEVIAAPAAVAHRPARLAWEQTGLPLLAQQVGAEVLHSPFYTCPLRAGCPVTVTVHDATFFTEPEHYDKSRRTFFRCAIKTSLRRAAPGDRAEQGDPRRADPAARRRPDPHRRGLPRRRPDRVPRADRGGEGPGPGPAGPRRRQLRRVPRRQGAAQERAQPDPRLGRAPCATGPTRPRWSSPAARGTTTRSTGRSPRCPPHLRLLRPGYLRYADLPGFLGGALVAAYPSLRRGLRPADPGGDGLRRAGADHARGCRCPRSAATRSPTPAEDPDQIASDLAALLDDEPRRLALAKAGFDRAKEFTWESSAEVHLARLGSAAADVGATCRRSTTVRDAPARCRA